MDTKGQNNKGQQNSNKGQQGKDDLLANAKVDNTPAVQNKVTTPVQTPVTPVQTGGKPVEPLNTIVIPDEYKEHPMIKLCLTFPTLAARDSGLDQAIKMLEGSKRDAEIIKAKDEVIKAKEAIIEKPNRLSALKGVIEADKALVDQITKDITSLGLSLDDVKDTSVGITFPAGAIKVAYFPTVTKEIRATGHRDGKAVQSAGVINLDKVQYGSAHEMAVAFQIKYNGMSSSMEALKEAQRYDSGAYLKADGTPVLVKDGKPEKEDAYIQTEKGLKEAGIDPNGLVKANKRYHPFAFTFTETGKVHKSSGDIPLYTAVKVDRKVNADFSLATT